MAPEPDPVAALERIRSEFEAFGASGADFSRLLAAVEAVLDLCAEHEYIPGQFGEDTEEEIPPREIRRVIARKLLGEEETDGD
jgi:hypothetical protein